VSELVDRVRAWLTGPRLSAGRIPLEIADDIAALLDNVGKSVCAYCGHVGERTIEVMAAHQATCPERPQYERENDELRRCVARGVELMEEANAEIRELRKKSSRVQTLPAPSICERDVEGVNVTSSGYAVAAWRDAPAGSDVPCTEVHLSIPVVPGMHVVLRLKLPRALDELVGVLLEYRKEVWP
jgi:hypothetical protein